MYTESQKITHADGRELGAERQQQNATEAVKGVSISHKT